MNIDILNISWLFIYETQSSNNLLSFYLYLHTSNKHINTLIYVYNYYVHMISWTRLQLKFSVWTGETNAWNEGNWDCKNSLVTKNSIILFDMVMNTALDISHIITLLKIPQKNPTRHYKKAEIVKFVKDVKFVLKI